MLLAQIDTYRSSHQMCSVRKSVLRNLTKFTGKQLFQSLFLNKVAGRPRYFPVNFVKFLRRLFHRTPLGDCFITYALAFVSYFTVSLANSPFTTIDTAIIRSSRPAVFCKKRVFTNFAKFTRKHQR